MGNSCSNQGQQKPAGWLKWKEPSCGAICRGEENCCFTDHGRFPDTYPPFLAARGIDEAAFAADIEAVNEHVRAATRVLFRMKDWRILILLILVLTAIAGSLHAKLEGQNGLTFAVLAASFLYYWPVSYLYQKRWDIAVEEEVGRLLPKYGKVGVAVSREEEYHHSSGDGGGWYEYYLLFKVVQADEAPPVEVVVAGEPPAEVVVAGEVVGP